MTKSRLTFPIVFIFLYSLNIFAQAVLRPRNAPVEVVQRTTPLAGGELIGFVLSPVDQLTKIGDLWVYKPKDNTPLICVLLRSIDGTYIGSAQYEGKNTEPGWHLLDFPTEYQNKLKSWTAEQLAVLAWSGTDCVLRELDHTPFVLPLRWGSASNTVATVLLNAGRLDAKIIVSGTIHSCLKTSAVPRTTYDHRCSVSLPPGTSDIRLRLYEFDAPIPDISFHSVLP